MRKSRVNGEIRNSEYGHRNWLRPRARGRRTTERVYANNSLLRLTSSTPFTHLRSPHIDHLNDTLQRTFLLPAQLVDMISRFVLLCICILVVCAPLSLSQTFPPPSPNATATTVYPSSLLPNVSSASLLYVATSLSITGQYSDRGAAVSQALTLWQTIANQRGGITINGTHYYFAYTYIDDASALGYVYDIYNRFAQSSTPAYNVMLGPTGSPNSVAAAGAVVQKPKPFFTTSATADSLFTGSNHDVYNQEGISSKRLKLALTMLDQLQPPLQSVAIFARIDATTTAALSTFESWLRLLTAALIMDYQFHYQTMSITYAPNQASSILSRPTLYHTEIGSSIVLLIAAVIGAVSGVMFIGLQFNKMKISHHSLATALHRQKMKLNESERDRRHLIKQQEATTALVNEQNRIIDAIGMSRPYSIVEAADAVQSIFSQQDHHDASILRNDHLQSNVNNQDLIYPIDAQQHHPINAPEHSVIDESIA
ncbi:unnamed protein product [Sphagnum balticum]